MFLLPGREVFSDCFLPRGTGFCIFQAGLFAKKQSLVSVESFLIFATAGEKIFLAFLGNRNVL